MVRSSAGIPLRRPILEMPTPLMIAFFSGNLTRGTLAVMLVPRCAVCSLWVSPAQADCPDCGGELAPQAVSGIGEGFTFTVNHHPFDPAIAVPYVIAIVALAEQDDLRVVANIVDCEPDSVHIGMAVRAVDGMDRPVFSPAGQRIGHGGV